MKKYVKLIRTGFLCKKLQDQELTDKASKVKRRQKIMGPRGKERITIDFNEI